MSLEKATELGKSLEHKCCEEKLGDLDLFILEKRKLRTTLLLSTLTGGVARWGQALLPGNQQQDERTWPQAVPQKI